jgi:hypothetical protein
MLGQVNMKLGGCETLPDSAKLLVVWQKPGMKK